ncbi:hypothetical protein [Brevibacillus brevis]|uniref:Uncharacterized protein n=1 Tax=Brevibacillus brevis TaxID=1393 RepID=A0A517I8L7_BREBE|nr:hypothetical protein [Brevibacillus brevis]QDS35234.1 hypothetical protein FPS98_15170 [Brevibacillus brevis]
MIGPYGVEYEKYAGEIYVSKQNGKRKQGFNVAQLKPDGELRILGYTSRDEALGKTLEEGVRGILKSYGWFDHVISRMMAEADEIATCTVCGGDYHERDVNLIDYEDDVCIVCEPKFKATPPA